LHHCEAAARIDTLGDLMNEPSERTDTIGALQRKCFEHLETPSSASGRLGSSGRHPYLPCSRQACRSCPGLLSSRFAVRTALLSHMSPYGVERLHRRCKRSTPSLRRSPSTPSPQTMPAATRMPIIKLHAPCRVLAFWRNFEITQGASKCPPGPPAATGQPPPVRSATFLFFLFWCFVHGLFWCVLVCSSC
jgi:hypothetical protein